MWVYKEIYVGKIENYIEIGEKKTKGSKTEKEKR
jgi:hypothetical protein